MPDRTFRVGVNPAGGSMATIQSGSQHWRVTQVANNVPAATGLAKLKKNGAQITPMIASNGVAAGDPPTEIYPADRLTVEWPAAGLSGEVTILYEILKN